MNERESVKALTTELLIVYARSWHRRVLSTGHEIPTPVQGQVVMGCGPSSLGAGKELVGYHRVVNTYISATARVYHSKVCAMVGSETPLELRSGGG
jgi:hypothetical protein